MDVGNNCVLFRFPWGFFPLHSLRCWKLLGGNNSKRIWHTHLGGVGGQAMHSSSFSMSFGLCLLIRLLSLSLVLVGGDRCARMHAAHDENENQCAQHQKLQGDNENTHVIAHSRVAF